ncbi:hypothetical protein GCM10009860_10570 [Microbacterium mitrae]|uniref:Winged helix-turn-helix transcriptional regulator n=1 Tax=Microbacterium mitrae TaxID=664640 RepID=A0A5C8HSU1_9MICO|nr:metalloregulator ArsR/SmtB family transcription factor [Microbacterium mitrae]TXK06389.1 winged helix-turn-helix transcriptional regulator [Microbacterium mitrae]
MADIFDVIADGTRREILRLLLDRSDTPSYDGTSVSHIVTELGVSQPTVSKHLKVLREAGLVVAREEGQHRYYSLDPSPLGDVDDWILPFLDAEVPESSSTLPEPAVNAAEFVGRAAASAKHAVESVWRRLPGKN